MEHGEEGQVAGETDDRSDTAAQTESTVRSGWFAGILIAILVLLAASAIFLTRRKAPQLGRSANA